MSNQVYISQDANEVNLVNTDKQLVITEVGNSTSVNVTQPITSVITVASIGPQGQVGPAGPEGPSGSLQPDSSGSFGITGSLMLSGSNPLTVVGPVVFTGSLNVTQGITGSLLGTAANALTASYTTNISGGSAGYVPLWKSNSTLGTSSIHQDDGNVGIGTLLPEAKLHVKGPGSTDLYSSFIVQNSNGNPSFVILGSGHVGIENLAPAYEFDVTGTGRFTNGLLVTGSLRAPSITGSVQGTASNAVSSSYALTASYLEGQSPTSSYALTASYLNPLNQDVSLTGNLTINGTASINYLNVSYESASIIYSSGSNQFGDAADDTQTLYGTVVIPTGSLTVTGSLLVSGSSTFTNIGPAVFSGSITQTASTASFAGVVGVGTTSPSAKLEVVGSIKATGTTNNLRSIEMLYDDAIGSMIKTTDYNSIHLLADSNKLATFQSTGILFPANSSKLVGNNTRNLIEVYNESTGKLTVKTTNAWNLELGTNDTIHQTIFGSTGNISIGTVTDLAKLAIKGPGATSSTTALLVQNSNASASLAILDNGNVGIGTTSPAYTLDVNGIGRVGASGGSGQFYIKGFAGAGQYLYLDDGAKSWSLVGGTNYAIQEDGTSRLTIKEGGNVGIGTANPTAKLFVAGTSGKVIAVSGSDSDDGLFLDERLFIAFGDGGTTSARFRGIAGSFAFQDASYNTYSQIGIAGSNTYFDSGNVGVGTTAPAAKLQVKGSGATSSTTALSIQNSDNNYNFSIRDDGNLTANSNFISISSYDTTINGSNAVKVNGTAFGTGYIYRNTESGFLTLGNDGTVASGITLYGSTHSTLPNVIRVTQSGSIVMTIASGSVGIGISGSSAKLAVYKSGSTVVDIQGSQGQLFSVIDTLSGSLMSVNDISGLPILEVFSDDRVVMGTYGNAGLIVTGSDVQISASLFGTRQTGSLAVGSTLLYTVNTGSYTAGFFDYFINSGSNYRAGNIMAVFGAGTYKFTDLATPDIGSTTNLQFSMSMAGASAQLYASASSAGWTVKTTFRTI